MFVEVVSVLHEMLESAIFKELKLHQGDDLRDWSIHHDAVNEPIAASITGVPIEVDSSAPIAAAAVIARQPGIPSAQL